MEEHEFIEEVENMEDLSIEQIFDQVFSYPPSGISSKQIMPFSNDKESDVASFNFEILISLFMESMVDLQRLLQILCNDVEIAADNTNKTIDVYNIKPEYIEVPQPWFNSFGFYLKVISEQVTSEFIKPTDHYCKILLKDNPTDTGYFHLKKINKPFTFILNAMYQKTAQIQNISAIFYKPKKDVNDTEIMYRISFVPMTK